jgi:hypothetical protein
MSISKRENLIWHTHMVQGATRKLLDDITEDEAFVTMGNSPNHICWLTGHMLTTSGLRLQAMGQKAEIPHDWMLKFRRGADRPGDRAAFPPFGEVRSTLYGLYAHADAAAASITDELLDGEIELLPTWKDRAYHYITFLLTHDFYHAGQVALIRRHLGRKGTFG